MKINYTYQLFWKARKIKVLSRIVKFTPPPHNTDNQVFVEINIQAATLSQTKVITDNTNGHTAFPHNNEHRNAQQPYNNTTADAHNLWINLCSGIELVARAFRLCLQT